MIFNFVFLLLLILGSGQAIAQSVGMIGANTPVNYAPVADPQEVTTSEDTPITITLTGDDANGDAFIFSIINTPSQGSLSGLDTATGVVTYTPATGYAGSDYFTFKVNDGIVDSEPVTVTITVALATNNPPVADPNGPYTGIEGQAINLDGSGSSDLDGSIVLYEWDVDNDGIYDYSSSSPFQNHTYAQDDTYTIKLRVTDNLGATGKATTTATISDTSPTADFTGTPTNGTAPLTVNFINNSTGYDQPLSYGWDFDNDTVIDSTAQSPSYIYSNPGTYAVKLTVTDSDGSTNVLVRDNYVSTTNISPTADPNGPYTGIEAQAITLDGSGSSDLDGSIVLYEWDIDNDGTYDYSSSSPTQPHTYAQQGTYTIRLRVTDNLGATDEATTPANISDTSPTANFTGSPINGTAPLTVNFTNNSTGYDQPLSYEWDFDNDTVIDSTAQNPSYTYSTAGTYTVSLTVTDSDGSTDALTRTGYITVTPIEPNTGKMGRISHYIVSEGWIVRVYSSSPSPYEVYLEVMDLNNLLVPPEDIEGLTDNPHLVASDAIIPDVILAFDRDADTAYVLYTTASGQTLETVPDINPVTPPGSPDMKVTPALVDFGDVNVESSKSSTVTVSSTGDADLGLGTIAVTGTGFSRNGGTCLDGQTLVSTASCTIIVKFAPSSTGTFTGNLSIPSNAGDVNVSLTGTGTSGGGGIR